jgi:hypothetical protein
MHPLESYLRDLHDIRSTGAAVKETSYYPPLANLLNAVGQTLKPRVRCVINLKNQGAGMRDGGPVPPLFQFRYSVGRGQQCATVSAT